MRLAATVLLLAAAVFLGYSFVTSLSGPIYFDGESSRRDEVMEDKLEDVKDLQDAYFRVKGYYANDWDSLIMVAQNDSLTVDLEYYIPQETYNEEVHGPNPIEFDTATYLIRVPQKVSIKDSLVDKLDYPLAELPLIPYSDNVQMYIDAGDVSAAGGRFRVPTVMVTAPKKFYYSGLDQKYYEADAGYQFGSLYDANTNVFSADYVEWKDMAEVRKDREKERLEAEKAAAEAEAEGDS